MSDFRDYCRQCTDAQVLNVMEKEREAAQDNPKREQDFQDARDEAIERGLL